MKAMKDGSGACMKDSTKQCDMPGMKKAETK
jgi:hypothetical protein